MSLPRHHDPSPSTPASQSIDAPFAAEWTHRLRFTRDVFEAGNHTLSDVLQDAGSSQPARCLAVIDRGVVECHPDLAASISEYASARSDVLTLVGAPTVIPGGERAKNSGDAVDRVCRLIHEHGICRQSYVLAIGGGAVLDAVGYAAAIAHRGVRVIRFPTTTLSQDDSGVGVKNGINAFGKKNFLGTFAPPWAVINDVSFLTTLTDRDWRCGFAEAIKVACVKDRAFFEEIAASANSLAARDLDAAEHIIRRSADLHLRHITEGGDPFEMTAARPLDFGHWSAHKLEQITSFELRHGEAVAIGIALDAAYARLQRWLSDDDQESLNQCLRALGFDLWHEGLLDPSLIEGLDEFREHLGGRLTIAMLGAIGDAFDVHEIDRDVMSHAIGHLEKAQAQ